MSFKDFVLLGLATAFGCLWVDLLSSWPPASFEQLEMHHCFSYPSLVIATLLPLALSPSIVSKDLVIAATAATTATRPDVPILINIGGHKLQCLGQLIWSN
ncbi:hypothetical protein C8R44DRAFT_747745 [Mycena epipterygia]|nr:hypothetical protein C8R44DRAFT_747745 [Mycena epipterygia]